MESPEQSRSWSGNSWWPSSAGKQELKEKLETNSPCECQEVAAIHLPCSNTNPPVTFPALPLPPSTFHPPWWHARESTGLCSDTSEEKRPCPLSHQHRLNGGIFLPSAAWTIQQSSFWNANTSFLWLDWKFEGILSELQNKRGRMPEEHYSPLTGHHTIINKATVTFRSPRAKLKCPLKFMWSCMLGGHYVRCRHDEKTPQAAVFIQSLPRNSTLLLTNQQPQMAPTKYFFPETHWPHSGCSSKFFSQLLDKQSILAMCCERCSSPVLATATTVCLCSNRREDILSLHTLCASDGHTCKI